MSISGRSSSGAASCCVQVSPPSVVARITESWPAAQPWRASMKRTAVSSGAAGDFARVQRAPWSDECTM
ncbi:hypothetical protein D3C83_21560 [compost metagenome]